MDDTFKDYLRDVVANGSRVRVLTAGATHWVVGNLDAVAADYIAIADNNEPRFGAVIIPITAIVRIQEIL